MSWEHPREVGPEEVTSKDVIEFIESDNQTLHNLGLAYRAIIVAAATTIFAAVGFSINPGTY